VWSWAQTQPLEHLGQPPIVEVICGIHFDVLPIDPVVAGAFWVGCQAEFPGRQILPALQAAPDPMGMVTALGGVMPLRTWLVSADESRLIQLQHDRFYLNWRRRPGAGEYPRFASSGDGLLTQVLTQFDAFSKFCEGMLSRPPVVRRVELGKVDHFSEGESWSGFPDLARMMPALAPFVALAEGERTDVLWRLNDRKGDAEFSATVSSTLTFQAGIANPIRGLRLDSAVVLPAENGDLERQFRTANETINASFAILVPPAERRARFGAQGGSP
jgi:uncharacterized protein (TIGR04255 family)